MSERANTVVKIGYENNTVNLLLKFAVQREDGSWDMSGLLSPECFNTWVASRRSEQKKLEVNFKESVLSMLRGKSCTKVALPRDMQEALLVEVKQKRVWPCFVNRVDEDGNKVTIGASGFRGKAEFQINTSANQARKRLISATASFQQPTKKRECADENSFRASPETVCYSPSHGRLEHPEPLSALQTQPLPYFHGGHDHHEHFNKGITRLIACGRQLNHLPLDADSQPMDDPLQVFDLLM
jgi:hypothetical protein